MLAGIIVGIVIAIFTLVIFLAKDAKLVKIVTAAKEVAAEVKIALDNDGKITKDEWLKIAAKLLEQLGIGI
jgi:hypothetical protein